MTGLSVTTNTRDTTPMGMLRGWVGRGVGRTALVAVASLVAVGPCHAGAEGTTAAGTLLVILGLDQGQVGAETQPLKGTAESKVNLNMATEAELEKLPGVGETTAKRILAGRPYKVVADLSKARVSAKTIEKIAPLVFVGETQAPAVPASSASAPVPSGALSSTGRASESVKSGSVEAQILPTTGMVWANVKSGVFHREGEHWYGKTEQGKFMTEAEARKAGYRPAEEGAAGQKSATRAPG